MAVKSRFDSTSLFRWLMPDWNYSPWVFMVALLICYAISVHVRYQQFTTWQKNPGAYFVGERPMMTTVDAPHWLRLARKYNEGTFGSGFGGTDELRLYPAGTKEFNDKQKQKNFIPQEYRDSVEQLYILEKKRYVKPLNETEIIYRDVPLPVS